MEYNISKELFEEVIGLSDFKKYEVDGDYIWIKRDGGYNRRYYSVNDFFFKCKEWANRKCFELKSTNGDSTNKYFAYVIDLCGGRIVEEISFVGDSEQQAVFDICQWLLDNVI